MIKFKPVLIVLFLFIISLTSVFAYEYNSEFFLEVAKGNIPGHQLIHQVGLNGDVDLAANEDIWHGGGHYTGQDPVTAQTLEVFSSSGNDDFGSSGAHVLKLIGLDANYAQINESVVLDGATPVTTTQQFIRMHTAEVLHAGATGYNEGEITARQSTNTTNVMMVMPTGAGRTMIAAYTIPANKTGYLLYYSTGIAGKTGGNAVLKLMTHEYQKAWVTQEQGSVRDTGTSMFRQEHLSKGPLYEKTDIKFNADSDTNNLSVAATFDLILVDNDYTNYEGDSMALGMIILIPLFISILLLFISFMLDPEKYGALRLGLVLVSFMPIIWAYQNSTVIISEYIGGSALINTIADQTWLFTMLFYVFISIILITFVYDLFMMFASKKHKTGEY